MKIIRERVPVIRKCNHCWSEVELDLNDLKRHIDTVWEGHIYFTYNCAVCGHQETAFWGTTESELPGEWLEKLFPKQ